MNISIANSDIALLEGNVNKALSILRAVKINSPYFSDSRKMLAEIYLDRLKDKRNYEKCY